MKKVYSHLQAINQRKRQADVPISESARRVQSLNNAPVEADQGLMPPSGTRIEPDQNGKTVRLTVTDATQSGRSTHEIKSPVRTLPSSTAADPTDIEMGLKVLYPENARITDRQLDIIAVHGLGAHPDNTWTIQRDPKIKKWTSWLSEPDMLPDVVPNARILRYGYHSQWFGEQAIGRTPRKVAAFLLRSLCEERELKPDQPLILIAHSFGGLVVMQMLLAAYRASLEEDQACYSLFHAVRGILFFGTPFRGASGMNQAEMMALAQNEWPLEDIEDKALRSLQVGSDSLQGLLEDFCHACRDFPYGRIVCFYETMKSEVSSLFKRGREDGSILPKVKKEVVPKSSACLDFAPRFGIDRDHFRMNKFKGPDDDQFRDVRTILKMMSDHIHTPGSVRYSSQDHQSSTNLPPSSHSSRKPIQAMQPNSKLDLNMRLRSQPNVCKNGGQPPNKPHFRSPMAEIECFVTTNQPGVSKNSQCRSSATHSNQDTGFSSMLATKAGTLPKPRRGVQFIGRSTQLTAIEEQFSEASKSRTRIVILQGMSGIGKSQIALEYCRRHSDSYADVLWLDVKDECPVERYRVSSPRTTSNQQFGAVSRPSLQAIIELTSRSNQRYLVVFDNYGDAETFNIVVACLDLDRNIDVLLTTRRDDANCTFGTTMDIPLMTIDEGIELLLSRFGDPIDGARQECVRLMHRLGCLPLAIDKMSLHAQERKWTLQQFKQSTDYYTKHRESILSSSMATSSSKTWCSADTQSQTQTDLSIFQSWEEALRQLDPSEIKHVAAFLETASFMAPAHICESMFRRLSEKASSVPSWMSLFDNGRKNLVARDSDPNNDSDGHQVYRTTSNFTRAGWDSSRYQHLISRLNNLSLVRTEDDSMHREGITFSLHPITRDWLHIRRVTVDPPNSVQPSISYIDYAVQAIGWSCSSTTRYSEADQYEWAQANLRAHVNACVKSVCAHLTIRQSLEQTSKNLLAASQMCRFLLAQNTSQTVFVASEVAEKVAERAEKETSSNSGITLRARTWLAQVILSTMYWQEAEPILRDVRRSWEQTSKGRLDEDIVANLTQLAHCLEYSDRNKEALRIHEQIVSWYESRHAKDPDHASLTLLLSSHVQEARCVMKSDNPEKAEAKLRKLLTVLIERRSSCILRLKTREYLIMTLHMSETTKRDINHRVWHEAIGLARENLKQAQAMNDFRIRWTARASSTLAAALVRPGFYGYNDGVPEAESLLRSAQAVQEMYLGLDHVDTLFTTKWLAITLALKSPTSKQATSTWDRSWRLTLQRWGPNHPYFRDYCRLNTMIGGFPGSTFADELAESTFEERKPGTTQIVKGKLDRGSGRTAVTNTLGLSTHVPAGEREEALGKRNMGISQMKIVMREERRR